MGDFRQLLTRLLDGGGILLLRQLAEVESFLVCRELGVDAVARYVESVKEGKEDADAGGSRDGSLDALDEIVRVGGDEPKEEVVRNIDKKLKTWRTSNPTSKGGDGEGKEGREGKRHKSASKAARDAEDAALDGP